LAGAGVGLALLSLISPSASSVVMGFPLMTISPSLIWLMATPVYPACESLL
jgi:hypothetical protein